MSEQEYNDFLMAVAERLGLDLASEDDREACPDGLTISVDLRSWDLTPDDHPF